MMIDMLRAREKNDSGRKNGRNFLQIDIFCNKQHGKIFREANYIDQKLELDSKEEKTLDNA